MSRWEAWLLHIGMLALVVSGAGFAAAKYLLVAADPFSALGAPWQPTALAAHVIAAPLLVFAVGVVFRRHVVLKYQDGRPDGRRSGTCLLALVLLATATGYALQVVSGELGRRVLALSHLGLGFALAVGYLGHAVVRRQFAGTGPRTLPRERALHRSASARHRGSAS